MFENGVERRTVFPPDLGPDFDAFGEVFGCVFDVFWGVVGGAAERS